jgi:GNAT superfamily N-acetyltransferase
MPDSLRIIAVQNKSEQQQFIDLPWRLYRHDPLWMPPLLMNLREVLNFKSHPFYLRNKIQCFLALRGSEVVGRIAAIINVGHNERYKDQVGFFGFYESINDQAVADALFAAAKKYLAEQGRTSIRGPVNPSLNHEIGLLVQGFDTSPFFMMTYNPPFYASLFEQQGLQKIQDAFAFWGHINMLSGLDKKLEYIIQTAKERFNVKVRPLDRKNFARDLNYFIDIYNRSLSKTWGFVPFTVEEGKHLVSGLKQLLVPELVMFAEIDGKPVGVCAALLDYNPRIKAINGRLFPFGFLKLLWNKRAIKNMRIISANVIPEYQSWGIGLVVLNSLVPQILDWGIQEAEFSWVLESNHLSRASLEKGGAKLTKTYRIYEAPIG